MLNVNVDCFCLPFHSPVAIYLVPENMLMCTSGPDADADRSFAVVVWDASALAATRTVA